MFLDSFLEGLQVNVRRVEVVVADGEVVLVLESGEELQVLLERRGDVALVPGSPAPAGDGVQACREVAGVVAVPRWTWDLAQRVVSEAEGLLRWVGNGQRVEFREFREWLAEVERLRRAWRVSPAAEDVTRPAAQA